MMVYIFGDLRQLRKFELSRPRISPPKPLDASMTRPPISSPLPMSNPNLASASSFLPSSALAPPRPSQVSTKHTIPSLTVAVPERPGGLLPSSKRRDSLANSIASTPYDSASQYTSSTSSYNGVLVDGAEPEITVSPAYFDPDPAPEGPATRTGPDAHPFITDGIAVPSPSYRFGTATAHSEECRFNRACYGNTTAGFIGYDDDDVYERPSGKATEEGRAGAFDFDSLPIRDDEDAPCICAAVPAAASSVALPLNHPPQDEKHADLNLLSSPPPVLVLGDDTHPPRCTELNSPSTFLSRTQRNCSRNSVIGLTPAIPANHKYKSQATKPPVARQTIENQHYRVRRVPAFGPVTRVLSPVVSRAQWEIVVRSALVAMILSLSIVGCLLAIPVRD
jgi:hypothetical protein